MNKQEIYYKFIFPDYENLTIYNDSDLNYVPENDNVGQKGEVRALCNACPERVITYDQLTATNPEQMYTNGTNGWTSVKKSAIKSYIDAWLREPKYFNLRNYEDGVVTQRLGMSLMVSHTPEVGGDYSNYTKFKVGNKTVYCAVMISSGDFFYNFCLPDEVIEKSGLRDKIVKERFHQNWYFLGIASPNVWRTIPRAVHFNNSDKVSLDKNPNIDYIKDNANYPGYPYESLYKFNEPEQVNPIVGSERRVFVQHYFHDFFQCVPQIKDAKFIKQSSDLAEDLKHDFIDLEATRRILYYYSDTKLKNPDNGSITDIISTDDIPILSNKCLMLNGFNLNYDLPLDFAQGSNWWRDTPATSGDDDTIMNKSITINKYNSSTDSWEATTVYTRASYAADDCAVLRNMTKSIAKLLNENLSNIGKNTLISYEPPDIYCTDKGGCPPLQIPYNLLRYCLNDRPPFSDCETVLVMWVADKDPMSSDITSVADLHEECKFQQYAIPISCRCCYKQPVNEKKFSNERFLVSYPHQWDMGSQGPESTYRYHTRCSEAYNGNDFKEVLYLRDLIAYSNDYIIAYQNTGVKYHKKGFDIQGYLFKNYENHFVKLYVPKTFNQPSSNDGHTDPEASGLSMNRQGQFYYIRVNQKDSTGNDIFYINTEGYPNTQTSGINSRRICICKPGTTDTFEPSEHIYRLNAENEKKWDPEATPFVKPSTEVSILGEVKDFGFDDVTYHDKYGYNDWQINDSYLIALFNKPTGLQEKSNVLLTLDSSDGKGEELYARLNDVSNTTPWGEDLYISSLGVTQYNPVLINSVFHGGGQSMICSLGILDNYIKLDGAVYGSETNQVIVGFKNMLDFHQEDLYHFRYDTATKTYYPVTVQYDYETKQLTETKLSGFTCTAYVMNYS